MNLQGAEIGSLVDWPTCWPGSRDLLLDGCRYGRVGGTGVPVDAASRIRWLSLQDESRWGEGFWPQPWEQCARVLRDMGHGTDARKVLIEKEKRQRAARRAQVLREDINFGPVRAGALWLRDGLLGVTVRYGREPLWALAWLAGLWLLGLVVFSNAYEAGGFKPNNAFVLRSPEWAACREGYTAPPDGPPGRYAGEGSQLDCFLAQPEAAGYPAFNPLVYSADALLPIFELGMEAAWVPDEDTGFGRGARVWLWVQVTLGWALSLLAVAGLSGLIRIDSTEGGRG